MQCAETKIIALAFLALLAPVVATSAYGAMGDPEPKLVFGMKPSRELDLKGVSVPLGDCNGGVKISFGRVRVVSKQVGAIRIGLLPELEVTGMHWEIRGRMSGFVWAGMVRRFFEREQLLRESCFRGFVLDFNSSNNFRLEADVVRFDGRSNGFQVEKPILEVDGVRYRFPRAQLLLKDSQAGKLVLADALGEDFSVQLDPVLTPLEIALLISTLPQQPNESALKCYSSRLWLMH
jgi:hypothetical protein